MTYYSKLIIDLIKCSPEEAPLVEGFMRVIYGTLDGLDRKTFGSEAKKALLIAKSYGLIGKPETK